MSAAPMSAPLTRAELVALVMAATTETIYDDANPARGVERPNILALGCRHVRAFGVGGYADPDAAALAFAGIVADAVLERLAQATSAVRWYA